MDEEISNWRSHSTLQKFIATQKYQSLIANYASKMGMLVDTADESLIFQLPWKDAKRYMNNNIGFFLARSCRFSSL